MRPSLTLARIATSATWAATRLDREQEQMIPAVLCYHRVLPKAGEPPAYSVTPEQFAAQMSLLIAEGFESLSLAEYYEAASGLRKLPARSVVVTFDDGFADNYLEAWPIARCLGVKINLFICTGLIAGDEVQAFAHDDGPAQASRKSFPDHWKPMSWEQLREMMAAGVSVGFHSHAHRNMGRLSPSEIEADAEQGVSEFKSHLGQTPEFFAFPYGHYGSYPKSAIDFLKTRGLKIFFSTELGRTPVHSRARLISRIVIHPEDDLHSFRRKLFGGYDWVGKLRRWGYQLRANSQKFSRA